MTQNKLPHIVDRILLLTKFEAERKITSPSKSKRNWKKKRKLGIDFSFDWQHITLTVCQEKINLFLNVHYLQALCENIRVDFSRDSINAVTRHSISFFFFFFKENSQNRILISYRNFSQTTEAGAREPDARGQGGLSKISPWNYIINKVSKLRSHLVHILHQETTLRSE